MGRRCKKSRKSNKNKKGKTRNCGSGSLLEDEKNKQRALRHFVKKAADTYLHEVGDILREELKNDAMLEQTWELAKVRFRKQRILLWLMYPEVPEMCHIAVYCLTIRCQECPGICVDFHQCCREGIKKCKDWDSFPYKGLWCLLVKVFPFLNPVNPVSSVALFHGRWGSDHSAKLESDEQRFFCFGYFASFTDTRLKTLPHAMKYEVDGTKLEEYTLYIITNVNGKVAKDISLYYHKMPLLGAVSCLDVLLFPTCKLRVLRSNEEGTTADFRRVLQGKNICLERDRIRIHLMEFVSLGIQRG